MKTPKTPISGNDLAAAVEKLRLLKYFPAQAEGVLMDQLRLMCPHAEALAWLVDELVNHVGEWCGPSDVRGLLCTRYRPADGIEASCSLAGYRAEDFEQRHADESKALGAGGYSQRIAEIEAGLVSMRRKGPH